MARQKGIINLDGKAGALSFFKSRDGFGARTTEGIQGERIKTDEGFRRTRENGLEFGRAGKASKLLRDTILKKMVMIADSRVASRLTSALLRIVKTDPTNDRGQRIVSNGDLKQLTDFQFNIKAPLTQSFIASFSATINRDTANVRFTIPPFFPVKQTRGPQGATHYRLIFGGLCVGFETSFVAFTVSPQPLRPIDINPTALIEADAALPVMSVESLPVFAIMGIEFFQVINNKEYPLQSSAHNAMAIVEVSVQG